MSQESGTIIPDTQPPAVRRNEKAKVCVKIKNEDVYADVVVCVLNLLYISRSSDISP